MVTDACIVPTSVILAATVWLMLIIINKIWVSAHHEIHNQVSIGLKVTEGQRTHTILCDKSMYLLINESTLGHS